MPSFSDKLREHQKEKPSWKVTPSLLCHPPIPPPMQGLAPRVILGDSWWNKTRKEAYRSTDFHCNACGVAKYKAKNRQWLEGHETYDIDYALGRMTYLVTVPLCHYCHNYIHCGRLKWLLDNRKLHQSKYVAIIQHGNALLNEHNLTRRLAPGLYADWEDWRLILDGKEYPSLYSGPDEWLKSTLKGNQDVV